MDHRLECKIYNYKTLIRNVRVNLFDLGLGNSFLDMTPKAQATKRKKKAGLGLH